LCSLQSIFIEPTASSTIALTPPKSRRREGEQKIVGEILRLSSGIEVHCAIFTPEVK
jgi:hypothetical protein